MFLRQLHDDELAQSSYVVGSRATGDAIVVDPLRDVTPYVTLAANESLRITAVAETHIHADFVSGARELAARAGAMLYLSAEGGRDWQYRYATAAPQGSERIARVRDGDHLVVGDIQLDVLHTPGHTPEHLAFLVTDTSDDAGPIGLLSGDFVFVGDVGRPDLMERATGATGTMGSNARTLFRSLQRFRSLPDHLQVWPGHGAGSPCGKSIGAMPSTTVGYEKRANWALAITDEDEFVKSVLEGQVPPPRYFAEMKRVNRDGPAILGLLRPPNALDPRDIARHVRRGTWLLDLRAGAAFAASHIPSAVSLPFGRGFTAWAGNVVPYGCDLLLLTDDVDPANAARALSMIGLEGVIGWMDATDAAIAWRESGGTLATLPQQDIRSLAPGLAPSAAAPLPIIDVRADDEWKAGHIPQALHIPLDAIGSGVAPLPDGPFGVHCQTGARSIIATSLLRRMGRDDAIDLTGGFAAWSAAGLPAATDR
jgi:hydroxyacylglutathione hydrolase